MKAVVCLAVILAVVAAEGPTESVNNVADILKETTFTSSSTPSSLNLGSSSNGFSSGSFSSFGNQGALNGASFGLSSRTGSSGAFGASTLGSSVLNGANTFGAHQGNSASTFGNSGLIKSYSGLNNYALNSGLNNYALNSGLNSYAFNSGLNNYGLRSGLNYGLLSGSYGLGNGAVISGYSSPISSSYVQGYGYGNALAGSQGHISNVDTQHHVDTVQHKHVNTIHTITKQVGVAQPYPVPVQVTRHVPVAHPYPVPVEKAVPVPYNVHVPVPVDKPYPVKVPSPVAVPVHVQVPYPVEKPYPVTVEKTVRVPVEKPVYIRVPQPVAVRVPHPVPVKVAKPVAVHVPTPVVVKVPEIYNVHKVDYAVAPSYGVHYDGVYGAEHQYGGLYGTQQHFVDGGIIAPAHHIEGFNGAAHLEASNAAAAQQFADAQYGNAVTFGNGQLAGGSYQIQQGQLVGAYDVPVSQSVYGDLPSIVDAKYAFKRETSDKKKTTAEEKKKL